MMPDDLEHALPTRSAACDWKRLTMIHSTTRTGEWALVRVRSYLEPNVDPGKTRPGSFDLRGVGALRRLRGCRGAFEHPSIEEDDDADECQHAQPRRRLERFGYERDRRLGGERNDEAGIDHAPHALAHDQSRRHERPQSLRALGVGHVARAALVPVRQNGADDDCERRRHRKIDADT